MSDSLTFTAVAPKGPQSLFEMLKDERYAKGRSLINDGKLDAAIEHFQDLLEKTIEDTDELSSAAAPVYYQYGASLFLKAEEASSLFADGVADGPSEEGQSEEPAGGASNDDGGEEDEEEDEDDAVKSAVQDTVNANKDLVEEMEIAWEVLEVARNILGPMADDTQARDLLARVYLKLGDVQKLNGKFADSLSDYGQCLELRRSFLPPASRGIADVHYQLAISAEYAANELDSAQDQSNGDNNAAGSSSGSSSSSSISVAAGGADAQGALRQKSLYHYEACCAVFEAIAEEIQGRNRRSGNLPSTTSDGSKDQLPAGAPLFGGSAALPLALEIEPLSAEDAEELHEIKEIVDELKETIAAFKDGSGRVDKGDIASAVAAQPAGAYRSAAPGAVAASAGPAPGVTTIGFGSFSSSSATTVGFGCSSSSSAPPPMVFGSAAPSFAASAPVMPSFSLSSSSSSSSSAAAAAAPMMVMKKKRKAPGSAEVAAGVSAEADAKVLKAE